MSNDKLLDSRVSAKELDCLCRYARKSTCKYFLEVGTLNLGTAQRLAEELSKHLVISIDFSNYAHRNVENSKNLMRWLGSSRCYASLLNHHLGLKFGVIFLDGGHSYEEVTADKDAWTQHVYQDGYFAIHDSRMVDGDITALDGKAWSGYREGPCNLVKDMQADGWRLIEEVDSISILRR